jgi:hypothetical protein
MRFEFFHDDLSALPAISVDGIVPCAGLHLSHWAGNRTPAGLKADTSTEIALRFVSARDRAELARGAEVATNNHFDTDGALSVWTVLHGEGALEHAALLVAAAEAGDFSAWSTRDGLKVSLAIQGLDSESPLAACVHGGTVTDDEHAYRLVLPVIGDLLARPDRFEDLWRAGLEQIDAAMDSFAGSRSTVDEDADHLVSLVRLAAGASAAERFDPTSHSAALHAVSHHAGGLLTVIASEASDRRWRYHVDWPYWSWADTVVRPRVDRVDLAPVAARLSDLEPPAPAAPRWQVDRGGLSSALTVDRPSGIAPAEVAAALRAALAHTTGGRRQETLPRR